MLIVINILLILVALVLIVCVLMQEGNRAGLGAISGGAETFFGKSKAKGMEEKLALITKISVLVFIVLAIVCTILSAQEMKQAESAADGTIALEDVVAPEDAAEDDTADGAEDAAEADSADGAQDAAEDDTADGAEDTAEADTAA